MKAHGFAKLIKSHGRLLIKNHRLHNVKIVIDAKNLDGALLEKVSNPSRLERVGLNLIAYGEQVELFFDNLRKCKIEPILVFDGNQTNYTITSKTSKKTKQIEEHIENAEELNQLASRYPPPGVLPASTKMILKSIALEKQVKVVQCFSEGKKFIAKIANDCDSAILSADKDFLVFDIKRGMILMETLRFEEVKYSPQYDKSPSYYYMDCELFEQSRFVKAFPGLDKSCIPLFASLAGNDRSEYILDLLPFMVPHNPASPTRDRLMILLEFLCNKSLEQNINSLCGLFDANKCRRVENQIREHIRFYDLLEEDDFDSEISKHYKEAFCKIYSGNFGIDPVKANDVAEKEMQRLSHWLKRKIETTNLTKSSLDFALRIKIFLRPEMDDFTEPSAHKCINRYRSVMLALMRSSHKDNLPRPFYDREGNLEMFNLDPLLDLENYGSIDYLIYDVCEHLSDDIVTAKLTQSDKTAILLATFHSSPAEFSDSVAQHHEFLQSQHAEEFAILKLLVKYVELEEEVTFPRFRDSVLVTYLYYLHYGDPKGKSNTADDADKNYLSFLDNLEQLTREVLLEDPNQWKITDYDINIVRNIVQMQTAIRAYEELNAFLGTSLPTLRIHKWFNTSFIYNYVEKVKPEHIWLPSIVFKIIVSSESNGVECNSTRDCYR